MNLSLTTVILLAPLAGAFATGGDPAAERSGAAAWIAQARHAAGPHRLNGRPVSTTPAAETGMAMENETVSDPFRLETRTVHAGPLAVAADAAARPDGAVAAMAAAPRIRLLGILVGKDSACAVVQIDGVSYRVRPGDPLPARLGRVLKIDEESIDIAGLGALRIQPPASAATRTGSASPAEDGA